MILFYTASQDTTLYLQQPFQNTGIDEILEISKQYYGDTSDMSRVLIQFNHNDISKSIVDGDILPNFTASLELKITEVSEIPAKFSIEAYMVSGSWENGTGTRFDNLTINGATWYYRNGENTNSHWYNSMDGITASFSNGVTGSWTGLGGSWYTASFVSQSFNYSLEDIKLDITNFIKYWNSGSIENNGIILKLVGSKENDTVDYGSIKIFSKETNTIYQPKLLLSFADSGSITGSIGDISYLIESANYDVVYRTYSPNLKTSYYEGQKVSIKIDARELYPIKQFNSTFAYQVKYYLPESSYYSIIDSLSKEVIIPYSNNSKIIRNNNNNLIKLNFKNWAKGRNYTLFVKSIDNYNEEIFEIGSFDIL